MKSESGGKRSRHGYLLKASQETNVHRGLEMAVPDKLLSLESEHVTIFKAGHTVLAFPWFPDTEL